MTAKAYLAGPIQHAADHGKGWRERLKDGNIDYEGNVEFVDPMDKYNTHEMEYKEWTSEKIVQDDLELIADCDVVLVHWPAHRSEKPLMPESAPKRECSVCGEQFEQLSKHYSMSECDYPEPSEDEMEAVKGMVMSDGHIGNRNGNPRLDVSLTNPAALENFAEEIQSFHPVVWKTSKKTSVGNNIFRLTTISHPSLSDFSEWYSSGSKQYPKGLELTPTSAKWWFVGDGSLVWNKKADRAYVQISCVNEKENKSKIKSILFDFSPTAHSSGEFSLSCDETEKFLDYIGEPVLGMEYKWCNENRVSYEKSKPFAPVGTTGTPMEVFFTQWFGPLTAAVRDLAEDEDEIREVFAEHDIPNYMANIFIALNEYVPVVIQTTVPPEEISPWLTYHADAIVENFDDAFHWIENEVNSGDSPEPDVLEPEYDLVTA